MGLKTSAVGWSGLNCPQTWQVMPVYKRMVSGANPRLCVQCYGVGLLLCSPTCLAVGGRRESIVSKYWVNNNKLKTLQRKMYNNLFYHIHECLLLFTNPPLLLFPFSFSFSFSFFLSLFPFFPFPLFFPFPCFSFPISLSLFLNVI